MLCSNLLNLHLKSKYDKQKENYAYLPITTRAVLYHKFKFPYIDFGLGTRETDLDVFVQSAENIVDLILESARQHLVGLVENKHLDVARAYQHQRSVNTFQAHQFELSLMKRPSTK